MQTIIQEQSKIVEIWLTNEEKNDPTLREALKLVCQQYKAKKYLVAFFLSGENDLYQLTKDLLVYNQRRLEEIRVQNQKNT